MDPHIYGNFGGPPGWGGRGGGVGGGGGPSPEGFFGFNPFAQPNFDSEREQRKMRIAPHLDIIKSGRISNLPEGQLQLLMRDLKEEGNCLFKEKNYLVAGEHYTCGLIIAKKLQSDEFVDVDRELLSSLFSNRAACCLKMDYHKQAIGDCDFAINLNKNNIKAYYRKATALKSSKEHYEALKVAQEGLTSAIRIQKLTEAKDMEDLIKEIRSHIAEPQTSYSNSATTKTGSTSVGGATAAAVGSQKNTQNQPKKQPQQQQPAKGGSTSVSVKDVRSTTKQTVDEAWLPTVTGTSKAKKEQPSKKQKKKKQQQKQEVKAAAPVKPQKSQSSSDGRSGSKASYQGKYGPVQAESSSSSEEHFSLEEDSDASDNEMIGHGGPVKNWASEVATPEASSQEDTELLMEVPSLTQASQVVDNNNMGLDDFGYGGYAGYGGSSGLDSFPSHHQDTSLGQLPVTGGPTTTKSGKKGSLRNEPSTLVAPMYTFNKPDNREIGAWQKAGSKPVTQVQKPQKKEAQKAHVKLTDLPALVPPVELSYPFDSRYYFTLACSRCYMKVTDGIKGYKVNASLVHDCDSTVLLIKYKDKPDKSQWIKIRPRANVNFNGKYMLCKNFTGAQPCRVGEQKCTFAHYQEEIHLWTLDRNGHLDINSFIQEQREYLSKGQMTKVLNGVVIEGPSDLPADDVVETSADMGYDGSSQVSEDSVLSSSLSQSSRVFTNSSYQGSQAYNDAMYSVLGLDGSVNSFSQPPPPMTMPPPLMSQQMTHPPPPPAAHMQPSAQNTMGSGWPGSGAPGYKRGLLGDAPPGVNAHINPPQQQQQPLIQRSPVQPGVQSVSQAFPLSESHNFQLTCSLCLQYTQVHGFYVIANLQHNCPQDLLAAQVKGEQLWLKIRERKNHRTFEGKYVLCRYYCAVPPKQCLTDEDLCSFAHNRIEQFLWGLEKDEQFNIQEFVLQNRSGGTQARLFTVSELLQRHPGDFAFLCRACFFGHPPRISQQHKLMGNMCTQGVHLWEENRHLVFLLLDQQQTVIRPVEPRPFTAKNAYFRLCNKGQFCIRKDMSKCVFAHSMVERDVWLVERDMDINKDQLVQEFYELKMRQSAVPGRSASVQRSESGRSTPVSQTGSSASVSATTASAKPAVSKMTPSAAPVTPQKQQQKQQTRLVGKAEKSGGCPFQVVEVCGVCWKQGQKCMRDQKRDDRCTGKAMGHTWSIHKMCVLMTKSKQLKEIRNMPSSTNIAKGLSFILCQKIQEKTKCTYGDRCTFAHSLEEMEVWNWMVANKVKTYYELAEICRKENEASRTAMAIPKGQTVVSAKPTLPGSYKPPTVTFNPLDNFTSNAFYCPYCSVQCNSQKQWDEHCASDQHMFNVTSDKEHQWNFRQPPWSVHGGKYLLCQPHESGKCRYSNVPDMHNLCKFAHSQVELDEWKERWDWRQMKKDIAKKGKVYSYMEEILDDYEEAESGVTVLSDEVDGATVTCDQKLTIFKQEKYSKFCWNFHVKSQKSLKKVALLINKDRLHFSIKTKDSETGSQIAPGDCFSGNELQLGLNNVYHVCVEFTGGLFGSFTQWVVFDFDSRPVLLRKLSVELGTQFVQDKVKTLREKLAFDRWTGDNREIVRFDSSPPGNTLNAQLLKQYKTPSSADAIVTAESVGVELNRHNYVHKMHKLLMIEELSRSQVISSYNLKTEIELSPSIRESSLIIAKPGELFAKVPLMDQLSEDTDAGKLILTSVQRVLVAPQQTPSNKVYEAIIVNKEMFDYDGKGKDHIYLCLSPICVRELKLESGESLPIEVQFQMHRLSFCQMHYAIDQLMNNDIVFPDISKINPAWHDKQSLKLSTSVLNDDQMQIVRYVLADHDGYTPPLIIYGPFGTGKTESLAQAAMLLALHKKGSKVLICTHSNSAADLYITKHFDAFITELAPKTKLVRIYFQERRVNTVHQTVQKYCLMNAGSFRLPSQQDIINCDIVITTLNTSLLLSQLSLEGHFTHIFLDEAAQAMECETIMPLSLANDNTCVVMAGDHMQIGPKVYSAEAKKQKLNKSLLERLFRYYEVYDAHLDKSHPLKLLLKMNYRSKMEILRFISAISYGGPDRLIPKSDMPDVVGLVPLNFYVAQGHEVQDEESTSYYNLAEMEEVVYRVEELYKNWPITEWGERRAETIAVVTPYTDQVNRIRLALRKRGPDLRSVTVERIMNMQGKEFRAVFISTVRTQFVANSTPQQMRYATECDGDYGDFGFLSDQKLLNTALTRAQSLVAVIGDPVALCAIGDCLNIWRAYLKHCNNMQSIRPADYNLQTIKSQVVQLFQSPRGPNIALINTMTQVHDDSFLPKDQLRQMPAPATRPKPLPFNFASVVKEEKGPAARVHPIGAAPSQSQPGTSVWGNSTVPQSVSVYSNTDENYLSLSELSSASLDLEDLLKQLCFDSVKLLRPGCLQSEDIDLHWLEVEEDAGHAVIKYDEDNAADTANGDNSDSELNASFGDDLGGLLMNKKSSTVEYSGQQLRDLMQSNPFRYKHCELHIHRDQHSMSAKTLDPSSQVDKILLSTWQRCGRGLHGDEVLVELVHEQQSPQPVGRGNLHYQPQGRVLGVLHRHTEPCGRLFVCTVQPNNTGVLYPLHHGMPRIYNLESKARAQRAKKGFVSVYALTKSKQIVFSHHEAVDEFTSDRDQKLFVVLIIKWDGMFYAPIGVVLGVLPQGTNQKTGLQILKTEYSVPQATFSPEAMHELNTEYPEGYSLPEATIRKRLDFRHKTVFTVGEEREKTLNSAFSLDMLPGGLLLLGVHIADVSHFLKRDALITSEVADRAVNFKLYDGALEAATMVPLLPAKLSQDICSLLPMKDRLALSLFFQIDSSANLLKMSPKKSVIQSRCHLTLEQVQDMVKLKASPSIGDCSTELHVAVVGLHRIARDWRRNRLGADSLYPIPGKATETFEAAMILEEVLLFANKQVALTLQRNKAFSTPVLVQSMPCQAEMQLWRASFEKFAKSSVGLTRHFLPPGQVCSCEGVCNCIQAVDLPGNRSLVVHGDKWDLLRDAVINGDTDAIKTVTLDIESKPEVLIGWHRLEAILRKERFVNSNDARDTGHYQCNVDWLTSMTQPLSSYMDIVLHKIFLASSKSQTCPYSPQDINTICTQTNSARCRAEAVSVKSQSLQLALDLKHGPVTLYPVIQAIPSPDTLHLSYTCPLAHTLPQTLRIALITTPNTQISSKNHPLDGKTATMAISIHNIGNVSKLATSNEVWPKFVSVPSDSWMSLLKAVKGDDNDSTLEAAIYANEALTDVSYQGSSVIQIEPDIARVNLKPGNVAKVQICADVIDGILQPSIQLFSPAPALVNCVEHKSDPLKCFLSEIPTKSVTDTSYQDINTYKNKWLPLIQLEAAEISMSRVKPTVVNNVVIKWQKVPTESRLMYQGSFKLPLEFCHKQKLTFALDQYTLNMLSMFTDYQSNSTSSDEESSFVCVRHPMVASGKPLPKGVVKASEDMSASTEDYTWVGHCAVVKTVVQAGEVEIWLKLIQSAVPLPFSLIDQPQAASMEVLEKPENIRIYQKALKAMTNACPLCQCIILGHPTVKLDGTYLSLLEGAEKAPLPGRQVQLDQMQGGALHKALSQAFCVIQGVAGAGKSLILARQAYIFTLINTMIYNASIKVKGQCAKPVVMICAPTDTCLNTVEAYLHQYGPLNISRPEFSTFMDPSQYRDSDIIMCTAIKALEMRKLGDKYLHIQQILIDHAHMISEPEMTVPLAYYTPYQVTLYGDAQQERPSVSNKKAGQLGLHTSLFSRYSQQAVKLTRHYRMHEALSEFPAQSLYKTVLQLGRDEQKKASMLKLWPQNRDKPMVFVQVEGTVDWLDNGDRVNAEEVTQAVKIAANLVRRYHAKPEEVAVLSFSPAHSRKIKDGLTGKGETAVVVASISEALGHEWDYVILSCVSSLPASHIEEHPDSAWMQHHLGSTADTGQMCVALTRARKGLIIIGNRKLLQFDPVWRELFKHYDLNDKYVDAKSFMTTR